MLISGLFGQTMIRGPTAIPIGNEANVTRDIVLSYCKPFSQTNVGPYDLKSII